MKILESFWEEKNPFDLILGFSAPLLTNSIVCRYVQISTKIIGTKIIDFLIKSCRASPIIKNSIILVGSTREARKNMFERPPSKVTDQREYPTSLISININIHVYKFDFLL